MSETYLFMSHPRPVEQRRKYRDPRELEEELGTTANLMFDPRVMRGVNCGRPVPLSAMQLDAGLPEPQRPTKRQLIRAGHIRPTQKSVAEIHENIKVEKTRVEVPLHLYLIEQEEETLTVTVSSQTDAFLEEPPSPKYIPRKTGVDVEVQVETDEVFNYDRDVSPILEVVIGKTMEQGLMEVRQEEELKSIARSKTYLLEKQQKRRVEAQKLLDKEKDLTEYKVAVKAVALQKARDEAELRRKLASNVFAERWLQNLPQTTFSDLDQNGHFRSRQSLSVHEFMPWLVEYTTQKTEEAGQAQSFIDGLLQKSIDAAEAEKVVAEEKRAEEAAAQAKREAEEAERVARNREVQLYIHTDLVPESPVGPLKLRMSSTVQQVEEEILKWLAENSESSPEASRLRFLWNGEELAKESVLYDVGVENLSTITMELREPEEQKQDGDDYQEGDEPEDE